MSQDEFENTQKLWFIMKDLFNLPDKCTYLNLEMGIDRTPILRIDRIAEPDERAHTIVHKYNIKLEEIK